MSARGKIPDEEVNWRRERKRGGAADTLVQREYSWAKSGMAVPSYPC